jgi:hypothetical protein
MRLRKSLPKSLQSAFDGRREQILFGIGNEEQAKEYMFVAEYDEWPLVKGMLLAATDDPEIWEPINAEGECWEEETPPEAWSGLPSFIAEQIAFAARMHSHLDLRRRTQ